jgi:hypothetical protein
MRITWMIGFDLKRELESRVPNRIPSRQASKLLDQTRQHFDDAIHFLLG